MYCKNCGRNVDDTSLYCNNYIVITVGHGLIISPMQMFLKIVQVLGSLSWDFLFRLLV